MSTVVFSVKVHVAGSAVYGSHKAEQHVYTLKTTWTWWVHKSPRIFVGIHSSTYENVVSCELAHGRSKTNHCCTNWPPGHGLERELAPARTFRLEQDMNTGITAQKHDVYLGLRQQWSKWMRRMGSATGLRLKPSLTRSTQNIAQTHSTRTKKEVVCFIFSATTRICRLWAFMHTWGLDG